MIFLPNKIGLFFSVWVKSTTGKQEKLFKIYLWQHMLLSLAGVVFSLIGDDWRREAFEVKTGK